MPHTAAVAKAPRAPTSVYQRAAGERGHRERDVRGPVLGGEHATATSSAARAWMRMIVATSHDAAAGSRRAPSRETDGEESSRPCQRQTLNACGERDDEDTRRL